MADDLGADFLKGYFGMQERRQAQIDRSDRAQEFAQQMQLRQQEFGLQQQKLAEEIKQHAAEGEWRDAQSKHQQLLEQHQKFADDWNRTLKGFELQSTGAATPVAPKDLKYNGPTVPVPGLPGMQVPASNQYQTAEGGNAVSFGGGQFLRPIQPQERAASQFAQAQQQEDIAARGKAERAMSNINDMIAQFPDSDLAKNDDFRQQTYSHMAFGTPMEKNETWDNFETKETTNWLKSQGSSDPTVRAKGAARWNTAFPIIHKINTDRAGVGAAITAGHKDAEDRRLANDAAEVQDRVSSMIKPDASDSDRNNAVNTATVMINRERKAAGKEALSPEAVTKVMGVQTKGIAVNPKKKLFNIDLTNIDPATGKPKVVVSRPTP